MLKNVAGQDIGAQMITAADGTAFTSAVTVYVTVESGTQTIGSVGSGVCTHEGNGYHSYQPATAETNGDHVSYTFIGTGAIPTTVQVFTDASYDRLGAPAGASVSADIAVIEGYTDDIGVAGAGLTNLGGSSNNWNTTTPLDAAGTRTAVGLASANMDTQFTASATATGFATPTNITAASGVTLAPTTGLGTQSGTVGGIAGTINTLDALDTAQDSQHGTTQTAISNLNDPTAAVIADAVWDEPVAGHVGAGTFGKTDADILADTNELQTDDVPGLIAALNDAPAVSVADILTTQMTESYAADGSAPTLTQALMLIQQQLGDFSITGTTMTVKQVDGSTTAATFTLSDATNPTSLTRAT